MTTTTAQPAIMNPDDIEKRVERLDGWLNRHEGRLLYRLARRCTGRGAIVEIGSWKGKSTIWLGHGSRAGRGLPVHAIDPHAGMIERDKASGTISTFAEFQNNIRDAGVDDLVVPHVDFSEAVARAFIEPVELIFIDGLHDYQSVKSDFEAWSPKVMNGGVMAFHDTTGQSGPRRLVTEQVYKSQNFRKVRFTRSITYAVKTGQNTALERLGNRFMLGLFLTYSFLYRRLWRLKWRLRRPQVQLEPA
jgi:MMP 1-O-methyltransferase